MINELGKNLSVVVVTSNGQDWEAFCTWYSCFKNLPEAKTCLLVFRNELTPFLYFQWAKRLGVPAVHTKLFDPDRPDASLMDGLNKCYARIGKQVLLLKPLTVVSEPFSPPLLKTLNTQKTVFDENFWFLSDLDYAAQLDQFYLTDFAIKEEMLHSVQAKESERPECIINYGKGVGRWIDRSRGCPFSNASGLAMQGMTANENRIIELWKSMCSLYQATH